MTFFVFASISKSDKVTDFAYGTNFVGLAVVFYGLSNNYGNARQIIMLLGIIAWGLRLALYLFARVLKEGKDARFDDTRDNFWKFLAFWLLQMGTVWIISLPYVLMYSSVYQPVLGWRDGIGIALFVVGLTVETVSDAQKFSFKNREGNKKKMCMVGLWRYSRHPNYFGEALVWWGVWSVASGVFAVNSFFYFSVLAPVYVCVILLFLSGIPTLEKPWNKKYGSNADYRRYKKSVPPFIPFFPSLYAKMPYAVKLIFFFEFPMYAQGFQEDGSEGTEDPGDSVNEEKQWDESAHQISPSYQNSSDLK